MHESRFKFLLTNDRFLLACIFLVGAAVRIVHLSFMDVALPFRSGGLFVEFSQQIVAHGYLLPSCIPFYANGGLPFAYPPLPFYVEAILLDVLSLPEFLVANLLPPCIAVLTLLSFYLLTRELGLDVRTRLAALIAYATMPIAFTEQIESAGLSEAFGSLALIWLVFSLARAYKCDALSNHVLAGLFWAVCVVASPGSAYASLPTILIFVLVQLARAEWRPSIRTIGFLGTTGVIAVAVSIPYWLTVVTNHGIQIFIHSFTAQYGSLLGTLYAILGRLGDFQISGASASFLWDVVIFCGVVWALFRRHWALIAWFIILFSIPREGKWMSSTPAALLVGIGSTAMLNMLLELGKRYKRKQRTVIYSILALLLGIYASLNLVLAVQDLVAGYDRQSLSEAVEALEWVEENTPVDSQFIVLSEYITEWTPHIARRTVLNVHQGAEWEPEEQERILKLQKMLNNCLDFNCLQASVTEIMGYDKVYLYVDRDRLSKLASASSRENAVFNLMWENSEIAIGHLATREEH